MASSPSGINEKRHFWCRIKILKKTPYSCYDGFANNSQQNRGFILKVN